MSVQSLFAPCCQCGAPGTRFISLTDEFDREAGRKFFCADHGHVSDPEAPAARQRVPQDQIVTIACWDAIPDRSPYPTTNKLALDLLDAQQERAAARAHIAELEAELVTSRNIGLSIDGAFKDDAYREVAMLANLLRAANASIVYERKRAVSSEARVKDTIKIVIRVGEEIVMAGGDYKSREAVSEIIRALEAAGYAYVEEGAYASSSDPVEESWFNALETAAKVADRRNAPKIAASIRALILCRKVTNR